MGTTYMVLCLTAIFTTASCQPIAPGALTKLISEIMSPRKTEQIAQMIKRTSEVPLTRRSAIIDTNLPRKILRNEINTVLVQRPNEVVLQGNAKPAKVVLQNEAVLPNSFHVHLQNPYQQQHKLGKVLVQKNDGFINEIGYPKKVVLQKNEFVNPGIIVKKPEIAMPKKVLVNNVELATPNARKILVQKANEIPMLRNSKLVFNENPQELIQNMKENTKIRGVDIKVAQNVIVKQPTVVKSVTQGDAIMTKPFFPTASSVLGTIQKNVPQSKGQFLRKIPIPPPTI